MKTTIPFKATALMVLTSFAIFSCNKDAATASAEDESSSSEIVVASSASTPTTDSVAIVQHCGRGENRDSVAQSALPAAITSYLDTAYAGYTYHKSYSVSDTNDVVTAYVVVIYYNDKPVGIKFDSEGNFVEVLRQRRGGHGRHRR